MVAKPMRFAALTYGCLSIINSSRAFHLTHRVASRSFTALNAEAEKKSSPIPITLLSGFLGTGKTTTLQHLLEKNEDKKIGIIVNDMASVNVDAKLIRTKTADMVELQNGCACCSLADELFFSVEKIAKNRELDAIVVELSGVADPTAIKRNWDMAPSEIRAEASIERVVTLVDSQTFGTDYMTWDQVGDREGWSDPENPCGGNNNVAELLAEQVEAANLVLLNKCDLAEDKELDTAAKVSKALNSKAQIERVSFGEISPTLILGTPAAVEKKEAEDHDSHSHDHACHDKDCTDPSHSHSHSDHECQDQDCTDTSHSHSHDHAAASADDDGSHSHSHSSHTETAVDQLGIVNFVYTKARPFNPNRLMTLLNSWPVPKKNTLDLGLIDEVAKEGAEIDGQVVKSPFAGVLRSKGFSWFAPTVWSGANGDAYRHNTAMYWSHAGKHFSFTAAGKWWGSMPRAKMKKFFDENMEEYERIIANDFISNEWADRRQELVFIGVNIDEDLIRAALDECLVTDGEFEIYRRNLQDYEETMGLDDSWR